jgi:hypothetical protein
VIDKVRDLEATMLDEADALNNEEAREHIYELFNFIEDWEAVWTNSEYDKVIKNE